MPDFDNIISNLVYNYLSANGGKRIFFDFGNVTKRSVESLKHTLSLLGNLSERVPVTLSLNEHEAALVFSYYGIKNVDDINRTAKSASELRKIVGIDEIVVHNPHYAVAAASESVGAVRQKFAENPIKTAGAGDTFNGGYVFASLGNLDINQKLIIANAAASFYINNGMPPDRSELIGEIKGFGEWSK